ncbi:sensor histidine kinase [Streptomyces alfalfae]|uniref:Sensor histidine kinase n=1 Tax=Streptomyces alfalfae TaxID=1642299 RepID=A0A7T4PMW9_9ACTN|nr:histidine kinase [Streptomyces alfalfae]QQC93218.1 sensor histidine kinase [Streptomyces alfalfae]
MADTDGRVAAAHERRGPDGSWTRGQLRTWHLSTILPPLAIVGVVLVAVDARSWWEAVVLVPGLLAAMLVVERWTAGDASRVALPCLIVVAAVWPLGVLVSDSHTAFYGLLIVGPYLVSQLPGNRAPATLALCGYVAAVGAARLLVSRDGVVEELLRCVAIPTGATALAVGCMIANQRFYEIIEQSREREAELAVVRERMRFASDLHDIQGHTLHVVKLKVALAEKLVHTDIDRVREELREVRALVGDTISQTKELAYAQRRLNLSVELENAKNLFEAAGIRVRVDREADVDDRGGELLGQVLRETTTNILRHAEATRVRITLSETGITIVNDGAGTEPVPGLGGLAALRERVADNGGELTVEQKDGRFLTSARFPRVRPGVRKDDR